MAVASATAAWGQFSPNGGQAGSTAIHRNSPTFAAWATEVSVEAGYLDVARPGLGRVNVDTADRALGPANGKVVSLGDGGRATLRFGGVIQNGEGVDFVVFENGFPTADGSIFAELAFVEVSSDGQTFVRFPAMSLTPAPVGSFGTLRAERVDGFAGKFSAPYGVGFDLSDLPAAEGFDASRVTQVRLVDVVGTGDTALLARTFDHVTTDGEGAVVYDPYPTPFASGGFDLDAVGVVHGVVTSAAEVSAQRRPELSGAILRTSAPVPAGRWDGLEYWVDMYGRRFGASRTAPDAPGWYVGLDASGAPIARVVVQ